MQAEIHLTNYVPLPNHSEVLAKNPSAKVFREVRVVVRPAFTDVYFGSVGKRTVEGGYRAAPIDTKTTQLPTELFLSGESIMGDSVIASECWSVGNELMKIRATIWGAKKDMVGVFHMAARTTK